MIASRFAFAAGAAGAVGAALLLAGAVPGSAPAALLLVATARAAPAAARLGAPPGEDVALRALRDQVRLSPVWALVLAAGVVRAASADLPDVRGAHAVAGLALVHGSTAAVAGAWAALVAGVVALAASGTRVPIARTEPWPTTAGDGIGLRQARALDALDAAAVVAQALLLVALFAGPHVSRPGDVVPWVAGVPAVLGGAIIVERFTRGASVWPAAVGLAAAGLGLVLSGGPL